MGCGGGSLIRTCLRVNLHLLEAQELDDGQVHRGVEPQSPLVGAQSLIELNTEATVHLSVACGKRRVPCVMLTSFHGTLKHGTGRYGRTLVISPSNSELQHPLGLRQALEDLDVPAREQGVLVAMECTKCTALPPSSSNVASAHEGDTFTQ